MPWQRTTTDNGGDRRGADDLRGRAGRRRRRGRGGRARGLPWISIRGKEFKISGEKQVNPMEAIILLSGFENAYYEDGFDPDSHDTPDCFALGMEADGMKPHPDSPKPQHHECATCRMNQFGSAERGKGKACKNSRRLALMVGAAPLSRGVSVSPAQVFAESCARFTQRDRVPPEVVGLTLGFFDDQTDDQARNFDL